MTHLPMVSKAGTQRVMEGRYSPIQVRLTNAERDTIKQLAAARYGLTISEYLRALVNLDAKGKVDWSALPDVLAKGAKRLPDDAAPLPPPKPTRGTVGRSKSGKRKRARKPPVAAAPPKGFV